jgi:hypothetical protein
VNCEKLANASDSANSLKQDTHIKRSVKEQHVMAHNVQVEAD